MQNFSELNSFSVKKIHQLTEKVSTLQKNLTELIRAQEQTVVVNKERSHTIFFVVTDSLRFQAISVTNNNTVATLSSFDLIVRNPLSLISVLLD